MKKFLAVAILLAAYAASPQPAAPATTCELACAVNRYLAYQHCLEELPGEISACLYYAQLVEAECLASCEET